MKKEILGLIDRVRDSIDRLGWVDEGEKNYFDQQRGRYAFMLQQLKDRVKPSCAVLDIGSHLLHFAMAARVLGYTVSGADVEFFVKHPLNKSRQQEYGIPDVRICDLSKDALPFADRTFDVVNFSEALEHLNFNPLPVIKEFWRVLKPGGIAIITTPNALRLGSRVRFLLGRNVFADLNDLCWGPPFAVHYREYSLNELAQLMEWGGFRVTVRQARYLYPEVGLRKFAKQVIECAMPTLAGNLFVIGTK